MRRASLNHCYRLVWNELTQAWVAVAEFVKAKGKRSGAVLLAAGLISAPSFALDPGALPTGGSIAAGSGSIARNGNGMAINQATQNLAIHWQSYNVGANASVTYRQPNAGAIALNRVLGTDGSQILGQIKANGQVWLVNPNGVLFGKGAQVDVGGLVASTLNISDADFLAGKRTFAGNAGTVDNQGAIRAATVALLGEQAKNSGDIVVANLGTAVLAAGNKVTVDFAGDKLLNVQVDEGALKALAENKGLIQADGGSIVMTAKAKDALLDTAVNNSGVLRARTVENHGGVIKLLADMQSGTVKVAGTLDASAPQLPPLQGEGRGGDGVQHAQDGANGGWIETSAAHSRSPTAPRSPRNPPPAKTANG